MEVAGTAVGVASLGIQVCECLVRYYSDWKGCGQDIAETARCVESLGSIFKALKALLEGHQLGQDHAVLVEKCLESCKSGIEGLRKRYAKFDSPSRVRKELVRLLYPFKVATLVKVKQLVSELVVELQLALQLQNLSESVEMHASSLDTLNSIQSDVSTITTNLQSINGLVASIESSTLDIQGTVARVEDDTSYLRGEHLAQKKSALLDWLCPHDFAKQQQQRLDSRTPGTGLWLLEHPHFRDWAAGSQPNLLCAGDPGAGKTMLAAISIDYLLRNVHSAETCVAFIYCNYKRQDEQNASCLLLGILRQLLSAQNVVPLVVSTLKDVHTRKQTRPNLSELQDLFSVLLLNIKRLVIVTDALDECDARARKYYLQVICALQSRHNVAHMATSRSIPDVVAEFGATKLIQIKASNTDVQKYVDDQYRQLSKSVQKNVGLRGKILDAMVDAAAGIFLLVRLHMDSLKDCMTVKQATAFLDHVRTGSDAYDAAYATAMERIYGQRKGFRDLARKVLAWLVCARRQLQGVEFRYALAVEHGEPDLDPENELDVDDVLSVCAGLVVYDGTFRLIHFTTQEYLARNQARWLPDAHCEIAHTCISVLSFGVSLDKDELANADSHVANHAMVKYSARWWAYHYKAATDDINSSATTVLRKSANEFLLRDRATTRASGYSVVGGVNGRCALHLIAESGIADLIPPLLAEMASHDPRDSLGRTPLMLAALCGNVRVCQLLVDEGQVDINARDYQNNTPLHLAADRRFGEVVDILISAGRINFLSQNYCGLTPMLSAMMGAGNVRSPWVKRLFEAGAAGLHIPNDYGWTPLRMAAAWGCEELVPSLLEAPEVDVDWRSPEGQTALLVASRARRAKIMDMLIATGEADVNAKDVSGSTVLMEEVAWRLAGPSMLEPTRMLLDAGADASSVDNSGRSVLMCLLQVSHGNESDPVFPELAQVTRMLLDAGALADALDRKGRTALMYAIEAGAFEAVKVLLQTGNALLHARNHAGRNAFDLASRRTYMGKERMLRFLWEASAALPDLETASDTALGPALDGKVASADDVGDCEQTSSKKG